MSHTDLLTLAHWMAGDFSNQKQSQEKPREFSHIRVFFRPLPLDFFGGVGFYSEQAYDYDLWAPYRQGIHRFVDQGDHIYIENYGLQTPMLYAGAAREPSILASITPEVIERRMNCSMVFRRQGESFVGSVEPGNQCLIDRGGCQTYLVSQVEVSEGYWSSWDRGMSCETHEPIWGGEHGPMHFERWQSFADEVPTIQTGGD